MNRLRTFIIDIHRRSIWQVLGIYLVGSWLGYQVIHALTDGLGLPAWVPPFAVVLFIIGLPIVLATAFVQEGLPQAGSMGPADPTLLPDVERFGTATFEDRQNDTGRPAADSNPAESAPSRAASLLTWRRALVGGFTAFVLLGLSAGSYMGMRVAGIGPAGTLLGRGDITELDRLVLADFGATGADTLLAAAITDALRIDLEQSRAVSLVSPTYVQGSLQRMDQPSGARLPEVIALQLAQREGLKAVITGDIARVGNSFTVNARVLRASDGEPLVSVREPARTEADLLDAVDRLSRRLRERVGESLRTVRASEPLAQVTTGSIEALQLFSQASRLQVSGTSTDADRARQLAEQAIAIDPEFAMAYRLLAFISGNNVFDGPRARAMMTRAYELSDRLTERERLLTVASYHRTVTGENERAITAYEQVLARYPDDLSALNNVAVIYSEQGDRDQAAEMYRRLIEQDSTRRISHANLIVALAGSGRVEDAQAALELTRRRFPTDPQLHRFEAIVHAARGDLAAAERSAETFVTEARAALPRALGVGDLAVLASMRGRPARAFAQADEMLTLLLQGDARAAVMVIAVQLGIARIQDLGEPPAAVTTAVEARLRELGFDTVPPEERPYPSLAVLYAAAGQHARSRELRDSFARDVVEPSGQRSLEVALLVLDGELLIFEGRAAEGARLLRSARERSGCDRCYIPLLAWAFDEAAMPDSAVAYYEKYLATPIALGPIEFRWRTRALMRTAELQAARGDRDRARLHYGRLLELWNDPEPSMRPRVEAVRSRLAALMGPG
ncbi:MAG TPA: tetratricopeptide repeat protein [Burkholderiales bacterium]|nr:tetratricopeptide repeat protein [Burkholderiales bacterium]